MNYSIIVIGDELLIGQVTDTNSGWIERALTPSGWSARYVKVIHDNADDITQAIDEAFTLTPLVLLTGGLGPTRDDITKGTLCRYFGGEMVLDEGVKAQVDETFRRRGIKMNPLTASQAMVPSSCTVIPNEVGTAPVMWFEKDDKVLVSMPGVPFEMQHAMNHYVVERVNRHFGVGQAIEHRTTMVFGVPESELAMRLERFEDELPADAHLAYLPDQGIVRLRLSGYNLSDSDDKLDETLHGTMHFRGDKPLALIVGEQLKERGLTLSTAESCTGGNIAHRLTLIAGSSDYFKGTVVAYDNSVKQRVLGVDGNDLESHGAVSQPVVEAMSKGVAKVMNTDCAVATSGIAGPGGATPNKPVGTVWIAATVGNKTVSRLLHLPGNRERVIERATTNALTLLLEMLG